MVIFEATTHADEDCQEKCVRTKIVFTDIGSIENLSNKNLVINSKNTKVKSKQKTLKQQVY